MGSSVGAVYLHTAAQAYTATFYFFLFYFTINKILFQESNGKDKAEVRHQT